VAGKNYKRKIVLEFDGSSVNKGTADVNKQMALLNAEFNKSSAQAVNTGTSYDKLGLKQEVLKEKVRLQAEKVALLTTKVTELSTAENKNQTAISSKTIELKNAQAQLSRLETQYQRVNNEVAKSNTVFGKAKMELENFRMGADRAGINLDSLKNQFMATAAAVVAFGVVATKAFLTFDQAMVKSRTIMDETQVSYNDMTNHVLDMSKKYGLAADVMANANYQILSSGIETSKVNIVLEQSARLAKAGFTDASTAADILTSAINGYGKSADDARGIVDSFIITQKLGKLTIGDLSASMGDLISISASAKVPLEQVEAAIATMTLSGVKADTAITNVKQIMSALISPTAEAAQAAKDLGIQFNVAALERKGFAGFMDDVMRKTGGSKEEIGKLFGNIKSLSGMLNLTSDGGKKFTEVLDQIKNSSGATDEALNILGQTSSGRLTVSLNDLKVSLVKLGEALSPIIDFLSIVAKVVASIPAPVTMGVIAFASMAKILGLLSAALIALGAGSGVASAGIASLGLAGGISLPVILAIAAAIALVVGLLVLLSKGSNEASNALKKVGADSASVAGQVTANANKLKGSVNQAGYKSYAIGTNYHTGGLAKTNDGNGDELIDLPRGSRVYTAQQSKEMMENMKVDNTGVENKLDALLAEFEQLKQAFIDMPRKQVQFAREG
jgi:TP901 family phage tail tape measure protein